MALGLVLLAVVSVLVLLGLAHRVLDRMYLSDGGALLFLGGMIAGSFVDIPFSRGVNPITLNVGGAILPVGLAVYVLARAGTAWEKWRADPGDRPHHRGDLWAEQDRQFRRETDAARTGLHLGDRRGGHRLSGRAVAANGLHLGHHGARSSWI